MAANRKAAGANIALATRMKRVGGAWVQLTTGKRRSGGVWIEVMEQPFVVTGPSAITGSLFAPEPAPANALVTTDSATVTASGGTGVYTYAWSHVSGDAPISTDSPASASTTFSATVVKNTSRSAVRRCTVSDGVTTLTHDVAITLEYSTDL